MKKLRLWAAAIAASILLAPVGALATPPAIVMPTAGPLSMAAFAALLNSGLVKLNTCHAGASAPTSPNANQCWADTTANPNIYKLYDGASWVAIGSLNTATHVWTPTITDAELAALAGLASVADLTTIAGLSPANDDLLQRKAGAWANRTIAQVKSDLGLAGTNSGDQTITLTGDVTGSGPGSFAATVAADSVALTTDTTGNYAAGSAEAGDALTGDSATAFFSAGTIEDARIDGSAEADEVNPTLGTQTQGNYALGDAEAGAATTGDSASAFFAAGAIEVARGGTGAAPGAGDQALISDSTSAATWQAIPDSDGASQKLQYDAATNTFSAGTDDDVPAAGSIALAGDVDGAENANDLDEAAVETELEAVLDLPQMQGEATAANLAADSVEASEIAAGAVGTSEAAALDAGDTTTGAFADARVDGSLEADEVNPTLGSQTQGNYQATTAAGTGIAVTGADAEGATKTVALDYSDAGASPALALDECRFTSNATASGYIVCEGDTADAFETRIAVTDPTADRLFTIPNADSNPVQPLTCGGTDKVSAVSAAGLITCTADTGGGGGIANVVEDTTPQLGGNLDLNGFVVTGLVIGTNVQAWDAQLDSLSGASANGVSLITAADYAAMRALLDLEAGTDFYSVSGANAAFQPLDADLTAFALNAYAANATAAGYVDFAEDTDNGANRVRLQGPASTADVMVILPAAADTLVGKATTDTLTNKTIDADGAGNAITNIENADIKAAAVIDATKIADGSVTSTEFQRLDATSSIQTQLDAKQASDADLTALAGNATDGLWAHTAAGTGSARTLTAPAAGFTITNPAGIAGNPTFVLANDLAGVEGLGNGIATRTGTDAWAARSIAVTASTGLSVSNGDGIAGNPTLAGLDTSETVKGVVELATTAEAEAGTDTARAVTAAGLLAAFSGQQTIYIPAGAMVGETTTGCVAGTVESATSLVMYKTMDCDGTTQEGAQFMVGMPKSWNESTLTFRADWTTASGTGDVLWLFSCAAYSNDDALATANFGSEVSVTDTVLTALDLHQAPVSGAVTAGGTPAENDNLWCRIQRDADAAGDTLNAVDARIIGVRAIYTTNAMDDTFVLFGIDEFGHAREANDNVPLRVAA